MPAQSFTGAAGEVKLMTLDPGHFHAALVQKNMYGQVAPTVHVYAPEGDDVQQHLNRIEQYNTREAIEEAEAKIRLLKNRVMKIGHR